MSYIFGGNTGLTYEQLQQQRKALEARKGQKYAPTDIGSGLSALGHAFGTRIAGSRLGKAEEARQGRSDNVFTAFQSILGGGATATPYDQPTPDAATSYSPASSDSSNNQPMDLSGDKQAFITPNVAQLATTDFAGIQAGYDGLRQQQYQQQVSQHNNLLGGILGFGANLVAPGAGSRFSDRRVKTDIKKVGKTDDGQQIYSYRYKSGGPIQMGLMADEVKKKKPEAVSEVEGVKTVNYGIALGGTE